MALRRTLSGYTGSASTTSPVGQPPNSYYRGEAPAGWDENTQGAWDASSPVSPDAALSAPPDGGQVPNPEPPDPAYGGGKDPAHQGQYWDAVNGWQDWNMGGTTSPVGQPPFDQPVPPDYQQAIHQLGPSGHAIGPWGTDEWPSETQFDANGQPIGYTGWNNGAGDAPQMTNPVPNPEPPDPGYGGVPPPFEGDPANKGLLSPFVRDGDEKFTPHDPLYSGPAALGGQINAPGQDYQFGGGKRRIPIAGAPFRPFQHGGRRRIDG